MALSMRFNFTLFLALFSFVSFAQNNPTDSVYTPADSIQKGQVVIHADERIPELMERYKKENDGIKISGYRVQLFSGDRKSAFDLRSGFMRKLPSYSVTVIYDSPNFKTQAGNFRTRLEAEKALEEIWPQYKSAFVVKTEIDLPALPIEQGEK